MRACVRAVRGWGHPGHGPTRRPVHTPARGPTARNVLLVLVVRYYHRRVPVRGPRDLSVHATPRRAARFHRLLFNAKGAPRESERRGRAGTVGGYSQRYRARTTSAASRSRQRGRCRHLSRAHATASNVVARPPRSLARLPPNVPSSPVPLGVFFFLSLSQVCVQLFNPSRRPLYVVGTGQAAAGFIGLRGCACPLDVTHRIPLTPRRRGGWRDIV